LPHRRHSRRRGSGLRAHWRARLGFLQGPGQSRNVRQDVTLIRCDGCLPRTRQFVSQHASRRCP
jgi:hypothetical protein